VIAGGVVATYLLQQNEPLPITSGDGAKIGLLAGVIGAFVYLGLSIPITIVVEPFQRAFVERISQTEDLPPEFREYLRNFVGGRTGVVLGFMSYLFAGIIFSTLGGVLGAAIFRKPPPPPPAVPTVIEAPPPTYP
jgi:MFS superfamily sulfate permease-like transporter